MRSLGTQTKLFGTIALLALALLLVGYLGLDAANALSRAADEAHEDYVVPGQWISEVVSRQRAIAQQVLTASLARNPAVTETTLQRILDHRGRIKNLLSQYAAKSITPEQKRLGEAFIQARKSVIEVNDQVVALLGQNNYEQATALVIDKELALDKQVMDAAEALLAEQNRAANALQAKAQHEHRRDRLIMEIVIGASLLLVGVLGWLLARSIMDALTRAVSIAERIAAGELENEIVVDRHDEFGKLLEALRRMDGKLTGVVVQVMASANAVSSASQQLSQGNADLAGRTQEQASALQQTATSMEQMTITVNQTADNAKQADQIAIASRKQADQGGAVLANAITAMNDINMASKKIADIIGVIDEIAFQTNLLALNAAVEAARAGEQGRGFAVVAAEVRNLAQRSASAAREIKGLIGDSVQKVQAGSKLVDQSGKALGDIVNSVKKLTDVVAEIASASHEQAIGIGQVNHAVTQMDQTTQQNASLVEEASAASRIMSEHAEQLLREVSYFRAKSSAAAEAPQSAAFDAPVERLRKMRAMPNKASSAKTRRLRTAKTA